MTREGASQLHTDSKHTPPIRRRKPEPMQSTDLRKGDTDERSTSTENPREKAFRRMPHGLRRDKSPRCLPPSAERDISNGSRSNSKPQPQPKTPRRSLQALKRPKMRPQAHRSLRQPNNRKARKQSHLQAYRAVKRQMPWTVQTYQVNSSSMTDQLIMQSSKSSRHKASMASRRLRKMPPLSLLPAKPRTSSPSAESGQRISEH